MTRLSHGRVSSAVTLSASGCVAEPSSTGASVEDFSLALRFFVVFIRSGLRIIFIYLLLSFFLHFAEESFVFGSPRNVRRQT